MRHRPSCLYSASCNHRYPPHAHDTHSLAVITCGALCVKVNGRESVARRGDVVAIDADKVHAGHALDGGQWKMRLAHVQPAALTEFSERLGLKRREQLALVSPYIRDAQFAQDWYGVNWCSEVDGDALERSGRWLPS